MKEASVNHKDYGSCYGEGTAVPFQRASLARIWPVYVVVARSTGTVGLSRGVEVASQVYMYRLSFAVGQTSLTSSVSPGPVP